MYYFFILDYFKEILSYKQENSHILKDLYSYRDCALNNIQKNIKENINSLYLYSDLGEETFFNFVLYGCRSFYSKFLSINKIDGYAMKDRVFLHIEDAIREDVYYTRTYEENKRERLMISLESIYLYLTKSGSYEERKNSSVIPSVIESIGKIRLNYTSKNSKNYIEPLDKKSIKIIKKSIKKIYSKYNSFIKFIDSKDGYEYESYMNSRRLIPKTIKKRIFEAFYNTTVLYFALRDECFCAKLLE